MAIRSLRVLLGVGSGSELNPDLGQATSDWARLTGQLGFRVGGDSETKSFRVGNWDNQNEDREPFVCFIKGHP